MKHPTIKDIESKIKVILFTDDNVNFDFRYVLYEWAANQKVNIFWITSFLNTQKNEQGFYAYFDDEVDAMAFKLAWT